jgi:hypothetical protein
LEIKYSPKTKVKSQKELEKNIRQLRVEAEGQLKRCGRDERFKKNIGQTAVVKLVLIFCGSELGKRKGKYFPFGLVLTINVLIPLNTGSLHYCTLNLCNGTNGFLIIPGKPLNPSPLLHKKMMDKSFYIYYQI